MMLYAAFPPARARDLFLLNELGLACGTRARTYYAHKIGLAIMIKY